MNTILIKRISIIAVAGALVAAIAWAPSSVAATSSRYITVSADGTVKIAPDAVRINATVSVVGASSKEALAATSTSAAAVRAAFLTNGVAAKDIASQNVSVYPEYSYTTDKGQVLIGYRGSQTFNVVVRNANNAGAVVDAIVTAGGNNLQLSGVTPFILDSNKAAVGARTVAVKNAKMKASSYASLLGIKLGKVNYLVENSAPSFFPPIMATAKDSAGATQIDLGQQEVTVSITIQWALS